MMERLGHRNAGQHPGSQQEPAAGVLTPGLSMGRKLERGSRATGVWGQGPRATHKPCTLHTQSRGPHWLRLSHTPRSLPKDSSRAVKHSPEVTGGTRRGQEDGLAPSPPLLRNSGDQHVHPLPRPLQKQTRSRENSTPISSVRPTLQSPHTRRNAPSPLEPEGGADGLWHLSLVVTGHLALLARLSLAHPE